MPIPLKLTVHKGDEVVSDETFDRDIVKIGRLASAHLKLDDSKVSRIHAVIEATSDGREYSIIDMGSTEGTYLNDKKISKEKLSDGDALKVGDYRIVVTFAQPAAAVAAPVAAAASTPDATPEQLWQPSAQEMANSAPTAITAAASPVSAPAASPSAVAASVVPAAPAPMAAPAMPAQAMAPQTGDLAPSSSEAPYAAAPQPS
ncbi:MAG: FHA domain-containing protein, partial [Deltaproteobacteria bacterium]